MSSSSNNFKMGRTIAGDSRKNRELELARLAARKRRKIRKAITTSIITVVGIALALWIIISIVSLIQNNEEADLANETLVPTVDIIDENSGNNISIRVKEFVAKIERDFSDLDLSVDKVILPLQKAREVDVYLIDRNEYFKMSLDRGSATQAEDADRMMRYLDENSVKASYVDLRIEGKAYYK
ncbi:MAG: hypothetical protein LBT19_02530 [Candidatus Nomurabacteria bacterium]|jgi:hypothetical protein|nr:hypothetical protein [Candidatus Nomurabacteria bacterium]